MGVYAIKPKFQKMLQPIANLFIKNEVHPDIINIFGLLISIIMALSLFFSDEYNLIYLVLPFGAFIRTSFNALDGMVARGLKLSSITGEFKNELFDRICDIAIFLALGFSDHGNIRLLTVSITLVLLSSYLGILGKSCGGSRVYSGILGKADRMIGLGIVGVFSICQIEVWNIFYYIVIIGSSITIIQRYHIIKKELRNEFNK